MRLVLLESPFAGAIRKNVAYARLAVRDSIRRGEAPIASHLLYTQPGILDDSIADERELGILCGHAWARVAEAMVVYTDLGITAGMRRAIETATAIDLPIGYRNIDMRELVISDEFFGAFP
jgi:hypothetical protein